MDQEDMQLSLLRQCSYCHASALQLCSRCRIAFYCSADCQQADFELHRECCRMVRAARVKVQDKELEMRYCYPELFSVNKAATSQRDVFSAFKAKLKLEPSTESYVHAKYEYFQALVDVNNRNALSTAVMQIDEIKTLCSEDVLKVFQELPYVALRIGTIPAINVAYAWIMRPFLRDRATHGLSRCGLMDLGRIGSASKEELECLKDVNVTVCMLIIKSMLLRKLKDATCYWLFLMSTNRPPDNATAKLRRATRELQNIGYFVEFDCLLRLLRETKAVSFTSLSEAATTLERQLQPLVEHAVQLTTKSFMSRLLWLQTFEKDEENQMDSDDLCKTHRYAQAVLRLHTPVCEALRQTFSQLYEQRHQQQTPHGAR